MKKRKESTRKIVTLEEAKRSPKKRSTIEHGIQYDRTTGAFIVEYYYGIVDGKAKREHKTFGTRQEAEEALIKFKAEKISGFPENIGKNTTFGECINEYITFAEIERTTERGYRVIEERIRGTRLYNKRLSKIQKNDINEYIAEVKKKGYKNTTINKDIDLIHRALNYGAEHGYIKSNPINYRMKLKTEKFTAKILNLEEAEQVFEKVLATEDYRLIVPFCLGAFQGMRRGEIIGLRWENVSFKDNLIHITETITQMGGEIIKKQPKTEKSARNLDITEKVKEILLKNMERQKAEGTYGEYVVVNKDGKPLNPTFLSKKFKDFMNGIGYSGIRFHDLRHSFATITIKAGANPLDVSGALGHSTLSTTLNIYVHANGLEGSRAINRLLKF